MKTDDFENIKLTELPRSIDLRPMLLTDISIQADPLTVVYTDGMERVVSVRKTTCYTLVNPSNGMRIAITKEEHITN